MNKPKEQLCCLGYLITVTNKWKANFLNKGKYNTKKNCSVCSSRTSRKFSETVFDQNKSI